ncbi:MAG: hypothetical protein MI742_00765 [Desulfobacterales bacterium]|nr:hypothetical protein [Desulfobacterales bacterium]
MKILSLTFQNLNSLASSGPITIDFEGSVLDEAGLFAITGPTGAGKTTILDAITLALFGKAARYDTEKPENMMSRGTGFCFAETRFSSEKGEFTARWDLSRARKKPDGKIQTPKRQLSDHQGAILAHKIREVDVKVVELTGLDYNRFLRSVLLAQGRFREFLDADTKDRGDLLERITGTEIYSRLSVLAHEAAREKEEALFDAKRSMEMLSCLSENERSELKVQIEAFLPRIENISIAFKERENRYSLFEATQKAEEAQQRLILEKEELKRAEENFNPEKERLNQEAQASPLEKPLMLWQESGAQKKECLSEKEAVEKAVVIAKTNALEALLSALASCQREEEEKTLRQAKDILKRDGLSKEIERLASWQKENPSDGSLEEALHGIRAAISAWEKRAQELASAGQAKALTENYIQVKAFEKEDAARKCKAIQQEVNLAKEALSKIASKRETLLDSETLLRQKEGLEKRVRQLDEGLKLAQEIQKSTSSLKALALQKTHLDREIEEGDEAFQKREESLFHKKKELELQEIALRQALVIESLKEKRARLLPGERCPLCGSKNHPYAQKDDLPSSNDLQPACNNLKEAIVSHEKALSLKREELAKKREKLGQLVTESRFLKESSQKYAHNMGKLSDELDFILSAENISAIEAKEKTEQEALSLTHARLKHVETLEAQKGEAEATLLKVKARLASSEASQNELERFLHEENKQLSFQITQEEKARQAHEEKWQAVARLFHPWGFENLNSKDVRDALTLLEKRDKKWRDALKQRGEFEAEAARINAKIEALSEEIARLLDEKMGWQEKLKPFSDCKLQEKPKKDCLNEAQRRDEAEAAIASLHSQKARLDSLSSQLNVAFQKEKERHKDLLEQLAHTPFATIDALMAARLSTEQKERLIKKEEGLKERGISLKTRAEENQKELEKLKKLNPPNTQEAENLLLEIQTLKKERDSALKEMGETQAKLDADTAIRKQQAEKLKEVERLKKEASPWLLLKELIGSADGSKFSRFAQGLTLGQLVGLANQHLTKLNPRYAIQRVPHKDLELEIVDRYQADAIRPMRSLSGGESFLVSLALALGLSEMAGEKTRIQSLFIDEGFGSLDAETLDTALAALEKLRSSDRIVGVISHVELLKNRIGAQIEVFRKADGHSGLRVVDR